LAAKFFWFLPTNGDSRSIVGASHASTHHTVPEGYREPSLRYLGEVARAADRLGFEGVLTPTGRLKLLGLLWPAGGQCR